MQSVHRAFDVMFAVAQASTPPSAGQLARSLGLTRPTAYRMLETLADCGVVRRIPDTSTYALTPKLSMVTAASQHVVRLADFITPYLHRMVALSQETSSLHVRNGDRRTCVAEVEGLRGVRWSRGRGWSAPIWSGAVGRMFMAGDSDQELDDTLARVDLSPLAINTVVDHSELRSRVADARQHLVASSESETVSGAAAVAVPLRDSHNRIYAVLSLYGPADRSEHMRGYTDELQATAQSASAEWVRISTTPIVSSEPATT